MADDVHGLLLSSTIGVDPSTPLFVRDLRLLIECLHASR
jgi:hypothetical protein